jgi:hypothetical protein
MLNELNEIVMPTSGTEPQELYHSNHDIDDAARYKVEHSDIPMASIIAQHDFRQKQMDVNDLSEDASVRSLVGSLSGQDEPKFQNQTHEIVNEKRNIVWKH